MCTISSLNYGEEELFNVTIDYKWSSDHHFR